MKGNTVFQGHYAQISVQFRDEDPVADALILWLNFLAYRVVNRGDAPFKANV